MSFDIFRTVSRKVSPFYSFRSSPLLLVVLLVACSGTAATDTPIDREVAVNAQLEASSVDVTALVAQIEDVAFRFGGRIVRQDATDIELAVPVAVWPEAFAQLRQLPEVTGGEQVWGQDITDQVARLTTELAAATGEEAAALRARLAFREERVADAVIVIRIAR